MTLESEEFSDPTISRCPHDEEHPYVNVSKALVRDNSLSPEATFLIIYLLCNKDKWEIRMKVLIKQLEGRMGKNAIYRVIKELIEKGYMKREITIITPTTGKGKIKSSCKLFISEKPKFKEFLRHPDFRDTDDRDPDNGEAIMNNKENPSDSLNEEKDKEYVAPSVAGSLSNFLFEKITESKKSEGLSPPKRPNFAAWEKMFRKILDLDKRDPETLKTLISWATTHHFWRSVILSPTSLRENFDQLELQKKGYEEIESKKVVKKAEEKIAQENKNTFFNAKNKFPTYFMGIKIHNYGISMPEKGLDVSWSAPVETFESLLCKMTGLAPKKRDA